MQILKHRRGTIYLTEMGVFIARRIKMIPGSGYLLDDRYSADRNIASVSPIPVLILHGTADHVIPWQDSEKLYALAQEPKQKIFIPGGDHIDAFSGRYENLYRDAMINFIQTALSAK